MKTTTLFIVTFFISISAYSQKTAVYKYFTGGWHLDSTVVSIFHDYYRKDSLDIETPLCVSVVPYSIDTTGIDTYLKIGEMKFAIISINKDTLVLNPGYNIPGYNIKNYILTKIITRIN